jgi:hypothetical protein
LVVADDPPRREPLEQCNDDDPEEGECTDDDPDDLEHELV